MLLYAYFENREAKSPADVADITLEFDVVDREEDGGSFCDVGVFNPSDDDLNFPFDIEKFRLKFRSPCAVLRRISSTD